MSRMKLNTLYRIKSHGGGGNYLTITGNKPLTNNRSLTLTTKMTSIMQYWRVVQDGSSYKIVSCADDSYALNYYWTNGYGNPGACDIYPHTNNPDSNFLFEEELNYPTYAYRIKLANATPTLYITPSSWNSGGTVSWNVREGGDVVQYWIFEEVSEYNDTNYATYPCTVMNITQTFNGNYSHQACSTGYPYDYPTDEACEDWGRSWMYCPCDEMEVLRVYGVGTIGTNTIWLKSTSKVKMPIGEDYLIMMVIHPEDDDLAQIQVGKKYSRGEAMFKEGQDGNATGNHFHISLATGNNISNGGWVENNLNGWVIQTVGQPIKIEQAFYLDTNMTSVIDDKGITFVNKPT